MMCKLGFHQYIRSDDVIYCVRCGRAKALPCKHSWVKEQSNNITNGGIIYGQAILLKCANCGERKSYSHRDK